VAYTDKGTGSGVHDLQANTVNLIDGRRSDATAAGTASNFTARLSAAERTAFNTATPNRVAVKHAHSEQNPEKDWGNDTLAAGRYALYVLNERYGTELADGRRTKVITPANTLVIASSVSNGAGAALAAAERDTAGLIDGVAVSEPNIQTAPATPTALGTIQRGSLPAYTAGSRPLFDYFTYGNLLQPCAALATAAAGGPFAYTGGTAFVAGNRCAALAARGNVYRRGVPQIPTTFQPLFDGAGLRIGDSGWKIIVGHGHAPEHASLYCAELGVLIAGDMVLPRISTNVSAYAAAPALDTLQLYLDSLDRLAELPDDTLVLPSHGRPFYGLRERVAELHAHHAARCADLLAACATEARSAGDLLAVLFGRPIDDPHQTLFAMGEAIAHLNYLEQHHRLTRSSANGIVRYIAKP